ncbi:zinc finger, C3HC4 type, putative [Plasmodium relictum]|uniref:Zinc finger, C3HC4 type, putative n=1 Tax=Plasmodium relictum TaxID=85471 RepID=A0A1J1HDY6_PLARL|nr:zinc finger, C3HC4 type, putative [Plasmodium relictum]CRH03144.1 zinc finger, C3HC4 type, putative [Plasmodium relictum]
MVNENYLMENNYSKNLDFKEVETEIKAFKIKQNETFDFYIDSINKLIENVEKAKKNLEEKKKGKDIKDENINLNDNIASKNSKLNKNDNKNSIYIKELIKDVKNLKITEKINEENKKFYNILLLSYKGIISLIKHEAPEIFKNVYIKKNVILRLILLHFLQKGDFFMYYVLNNEILKKKKKNIEKSAYNIDQLNNNYINKSNNVISKDSNSLRNKSESNTNNKDFLLNKPNSFSEKLLVNNLCSSSNKKKKEEAKIKNSINEEEFNNNKNSKDEIFENKGDNNQGNKNNVLTIYNNYIYNDKEKDINYYIVNNKYNGDKHSILLNNISTSNMNINNKESIFSKLKQEYIRKIEFEKIPEDIKFEHALIEKELFDGYKELHIILYDLKKFKVDKCIKWYNNCSEEIKKKYSELIYLLHCINYLIYSKNDKEKALSVLRDLMINFKENKSHISRLSTFICIGVDNYFFKNMLSNVNSKIFNYFKRAFNEEGIVINLHNKMKMKKDKKKVGKEKSIDFNKDLIKKFPKNSKVTHKRKKCDNKKKFMKEKKNSLNKNQKNETNGDDIDLTNYNTNKRGVKILRKRRKSNNNHNRSSSFISCKVEKKRLTKKKKIIKKRLKKDENILKRKIKKNNETIKQKKKKKKKKKIDSIYSMYQKEYALNIKINRNKIPLIHNNIYKEKYTNVISENFYNNNLNEENFTPLCETYMENNINQLIEKEKIKKNPFYYAVSNDSYINNNNLVLPKVKLNHKNSKSKNKNEEKLNKGWYKHVFNCTKDVFSEIVESQNDIKKLMKKDIKLNKGVDYSNNTYYKRTEPIYLYELSENEFIQFYQNDNSYITYKILNKAAQFYDNNDTKIYNNLIQNLNSGYNTNYINVNNSIYNENIYNNNFYNNSIHNNSSCNINLNSFNHLNNSCFIRKSNMLKRKFPKCKFLSHLCKNEKMNEKNDLLSKEENLNDILLDKKKKNEKNESNKDNNENFEMKETKKNEELKEKAAVAEYISSVLKKHKKNEDYEYINLKDINEETNEYSCNSFYSDKSISSNKSSDSSSENNFFNDSSYEENLKKKINKVKEEFDLIKEDYLKKNTMTALLNTKHIQAYNRAVLAAKNTRLTKTSIDVSRILLTHALTTRDILTLRNTLANNKNDSEFRRICLKWKSKKIKPRNRLRKREKNNESNDGEKKKKKKRNSRVNKKKKEKEFSKNEKEETDNDDNIDDYIKKKKNNKRSKLKFKCASKKNNKFISIVKPSISHSLECFGLEEFIKLTKKNLFLKKSDDKQRENEDIPSKSKDKNNIPENKKVNKEVDMKDIMKIKKEENTEKEKENKEIENKGENEGKIELDKKEMYTKENCENKLDKKDKEKLVEGEKEFDKSIKENTFKKDMNETDKKINNEICIEVDQKDKKINNFILKNEKDETEEKNENEINKKEKSEMDRKDKNEKDENKIDIMEHEKEIKDKIDKNNKNEVNVKGKEEVDKVNENNESVIYKEKKDEKDKINDDAEIKFKKEKKGVFYGSYKKNFKKRRYDSNSLLEEKITEVQMKRNKNEGSDFKSKKNKKEDFRISKNIKSLSTVKKEFCRRNSDSSGSEGNKKKKDKKKIDKEKSKHNKKNCEKFNKKEKKEVGKGEKKQKNLKKTKSENYEDREMKKGKEKEKKIFIHLESPLSILVCGGLISSKKLIEAHAILKENNKRLEEAKNNSTLNNTSLKSSDKSIDKIEKEKNNSMKKENGVFFSNSLAIEVDLSGCFFFHSSFTCPISRDISSKDNPPYLLTCGHAICKNCVDKIHAQRSRQCKCPMCPQYLHILEIIPLYFS